MFHLEIFSKVLFGLKTKQILAEIVKEKGSEVRQFYCIFTWACITEYFLGSTIVGVAGLPPVGRNSIIPAKCWNGELPENNLKLGRSSCGIGEIKRPKNQSGWRRGGSATFEDGKQPPGSVFARGLPVKHRKPTEIESRITRTSSNRLPRLSCASRRPFGNWKKMGYRLELRNHF